MTLDLNDLSEALNLIDQMIGRNFREIGVHANEAQNRVQLRAVCRACSSEIKFDTSYLTAQWSQQLMQGFLAAVNDHATKHQSNLILPSTYKRGS